MTYIRQALGICLLLVCVPTLGAEGRADLNLGFLYDTFPLTLARGQRTEAVGPFYYWQRDDEARTWAVPPFFSSERNTNIDSGHFDILWKLMTYDRFGEEYRYQFVQLLSFAGGGTQSDTNVSRFTLFPFYFQQRSLIPERNYTAVFPFYGTIKGRLFRDEIHFVMFPLYSRTRKRDVVIDNYVWPFVDRRRGENLKGWQMWPLYGTERKDITIKTNRWGDREIIGGHTKSFALWPFYFFQNTGIGTDNETRSEAVLPFWNYLRSPKRDMTTFLWPLGVTHIEDREKGYTEWGMPWPLVVFADGPGKTTRRVMPFFSQAHNTNKISNWYLWPVYKYNAFKSEGYERERTRILLFLYSDVRATNAETRATLRQADLWPLFNVRRDFEGRSRVQLLNILEPILPNNTGVERNLSPLWSIWRSERDARTGASSQSFLWNLYRRDATPNAHKTAFLFGLFQHQAGAEGAQWRLFYIPMRKSPPQAAEKPAG